MQVPRTSRRSSHALCAALMAVAATFAQSGVARAGAGPIDDADATVRALREEADHAAQAYFDALARASELDATIASLERRLPELERERRRLHLRAQRRAVAAYMRSGHQLALLFDSDDALTATRRRQLLAKLNERDATLFSQLARTSNRLEQRQRLLHDTRAQHARTLDDLDQRGRDIDATLLAALDRRNELQASVEAEAAAAAASTTTAPTTAPVVDATTTTTRLEVPTTAPRSYDPTPGTHPHHDDPFLRCTRQRESSGSYRAVNPEGPYLGAYQFLQSTWNSGANHAGRLELVGVPPNTASEYDQDDVAWTIYQWRGKSPWGDAC